MNVVLTEVRSRYPVAADCAAIYQVSTPALGVVGFIALHDLTRGPGFGGIRRRPYDSYEAAVADVAGLASQMTLKLALAELPCGGAKSVVIDRPGLDLPAAYGALGAAIEALDGAYFCGPDVGTGEGELEAVRQGTAHVNRRDNAPGPATSKGVMHAIDAALAFALPGEGRISAVVQGVGSIGHAVAVGLAARSHRVSISDPDGQRVAAVVARAPVAIVPVDVALRTPAELLSPCALGPVITQQNVGSLPFRLICGGANQQLETPALAEALAARGVIYVPDFAINAGAVIEGALTHLYGGGSATRARVTKAIAAIGPRITDILKDARQTHRTPLAVALERAAGVGV